eukprot:25727-Chlamydomonas_euryale.AAC.1
MGIRYAKHNPGWECMALRGTACHAWRAQRGWPGCLCQGAVPLSAASLQVWEHMKAHVLMQPAPTRHGSATAATWGEKGGGWSTRLQWYGGFVG